MLALIRTRAAEGLWSGGGWDTGTPRRCPPWRAPSLGVEFCGTQRCLPLSRSPANQTLSTELQSCPHALQRFSLSLFLSVTLYSHFHITRSYSSSSLTFTPSLSLSPSSAPSSSHLSSSCSLHSVPSSSLLDSLCSGLATRLSGRHSGSVDCAVFPLPFSPTENFPPLKHLVTLPATFLTRSASIKDPPDTCLFLSTKAVLRSGLDSPSFFLKAH